MPNAKLNYNLAYIEELTPILGDGISRTKDPRARLWSVTVHYSYGKPMKTTVLAISAKQAEKFTLNRHRQATKVIVNGKAT